MIKIAHLYYDLLNLYGENGNIKAIESILEKNNIEYELFKLSKNDEIDFSKFDFIYIGSGTEENQKVVLQELNKYQEEIKEYIEKNGKILATGNSIELFGKSIKKIDGEILEGLNIFNYEAVEEKNRIVSEIMVRNDDIKTNIIGFQNQSCKIENLENPWFNMIQGKGDYENAKTEGIHYKNFFGTYIIGPILVRNFELLKYFIKLICNNQNNKLEKLEDFEFETKAHEEFIKNYYTNV